MNTGLLNEIDSEEYIKKFNIELTTVKLSKIKPNSYNPNRHSVESFETLKNSIKRFGFNDPISVRIPLKTDNQEDWEYEIIDGEHRYRACLELDFKEVKVINFGEITKEEAMTLTQLLNHKGKDDVLLRAKLLKQLHNQSSLFSLLPGSDKDKEEELKLLDFDFSQWDAVENEKELDKKDDFKIALKKAIELEIILRRVHEGTTNEKLRISIEQFYTFVRMLKSYLVL